MLGFTARALSRDLEVDGVEIETARWFTRAQLRADIDAGRVVIPAGVSISSSLLEHWYGAKLPGSW
jgi:NAD+ diphosphatase